MISVQAVDRQGTVLAQARHPEEVLLCLDRSYEEGDRILIEGERHLFVQMDQTLPWGEVYCGKEKMTWSVPWGEHRLAYAPGAFEAQRHVISVRKMQDADLRMCRNLALNPADLRGSVDFAPHCTANVETRNEACFCARNVIDGLRFNIYHGEWPYCSWGIGAREDAWCRLDFGRPVHLLRMALTLRADFPHDAYWTQGVVRLSDGTEKEFSLNKTGERQWIPLDGRTVTWIQLERLVKSPDPSAFPALSQWEAWGWDEE